VRTLQPSDQFRTSRAMHRRSIGFATANSLIAVLRAAFIIELPNLIFFQ
jgi:hypothetical protein